MQTLPMKQRGFSYLHPLHQLDDSCAIAQMPGARLYHQILVLCFLLYRESLEVVAIRCRQHFE